jgi:5,10-methylenetetrahydromethanopterin reductase
MKWKVLSVVDVSLVIQPNRPLKETVHIAQLAEKAGFHAVWLSDENPATGFRDTYIALTAVAKETSTILLGPGVSPVYQEHPILTLIACTSLQEVSKGRAVCGIGPGGSVTLPPLRIPMWDRPIRMMRETIQFYRRLMNGETLTDPYPMIQGSNLKLDPLPDPKLEIMLALRGPQMARVAGKLADRAWMGLPRAVHDETIQLIQTTAKRAGRKNPVRTMNSVMVAINKDINKALDAVTESSCYQIPDTPPNIRKQLGIPEELVTKLKSTLLTKGRYEAAKLLNYEIVSPLSAIGNCDQVVDAIHGYFKGDLDEIVLSPRWERPYQDIMKDLAELILPQIPK